MHIVVSGVTGAGKTTWATALAEASGGIVGNEPVHSAYFYALASRRRADRTLRFLAQLEFLLSAAAQHIEARQHDGAFFQDHSIYEVAEIYTWAIANQGSLSDEHRQVVMAAYHLFADALPVPDVVLYLAVAAPTALQRVVGRCRLFDVTPTAQDIEQLDLLRRRLWTQLGVAVVELDTTRLRHPGAGGPRVKAVWTRVERAAAAGTGAGAPAPPPSPSRG